MNNLPHAEKPEAVYGTKNTTITSAAISDRIFLLSRCLFEKNSGIVVESPAISVYFLSLLATISQLIYVPMARPIAVHAASAIPHA